MGNFKKLNIWIESVVLAKEVFQQLNTDQLQHEYALKDQIKRSVISIASNIAEGEEMSSNKHAIHYFTIAKASTAELQTQLLLAFHFKFLEQNSYEVFDNQCDKIRAMLNNLIKSRLA